MESVLSQEFWRLREMSSVEDLRKGLRHFIWHCPICKKETVHRPVHLEFVACNICDLVQHKPLKKLLEARI